MRNVLVLVGSGVSGCDKRDLGTWMRLQKGFQSNGWFNGRYGLGVYKIGH